MAFKIVLDGLPIECDNEREIVAMMRQHLATYRNPSFGVIPDLEWEIRVYDYILEAPVTRYWDYVRARFDPIENFSRTKRQAIAYLKWEIK